LFSLSGLSALFHDLASKITSNFLFVKKETAFLELADKTVLGLIVCILI